MEALKADNWADVIPMMEGHTSVFDKLTDDIIGAYFDEKVIVIRLIDGILDITFITLESCMHPVEKPTKVDIVELANMLHCKLEFLEKVQPRIKYETVTNSKEWWVYENDILQPSLPIYRCSFKDNGLFAYFKDGMYMRDQEYGAGYVWGATNTIGKKYDDIFEGEFIASKKGDLLLCDWSVGRITVEPIIGEKTTLLINFYVIDYPQHTDPTQQLLEQMQHQYKRVIFNDRDACHILESLHLKQGPNVEFGYTADGSLYSNASNYRFNDHVIKRIDKYIEKQKDWGLSNRAKMDREAIVAKRESNPFAILAQLKQS